MPSSQNILGELSDSFYEVHFYDGGGVPTQLHHYLSSTRLNSKTNPYPFVTWIVIQNEYPYIWKVAKLILSIVAATMARTLRIVLVLEVTHKVIDRFTSFLAGCGCAR